MEIKLTALPIRDIRVDEFVKGKRFGMRTHPITKALALHEGIDVSRPTGTPVYAAADGVVIVSQMQSNGRGYGEYIVIRHQSAYDTIYAHLSKRAVAHGNVVKAGQLIGAVGSTGDSTGPHLHFGLCAQFTAPKRQWMDPLPYLVSLEEEMKELVKEIDVEINGKIKQVKSIMKDNENYIRLRDLSDLAEIKYDEARKLPIVIGKSKV